MSQVNDLYESTEEYIKQINSNNIQSHPVVCMNKHILNTIKKKKTPKYEK